MSLASSNTNSTIVRLNAAPLLRVLTRVGMATASALAPHWAVRTASRWFITPPRFAHPPAELALLAKGLRHDISSPAGRVAAWQFGDNTHAAVMVSHGWGGRGAQFRAFIPALVDAGFQVWLFDHVGHGLSEGKQASLVDFATGFVAVHHHIEAHGASVHGVISHSLGAAGAIAALRGFARNAAVDVSRVVMIAPPASLKRYSHFFARYVGIPERIRAAMQWRFEQRYGVKWHEFEMPQAVSNMRASALVIHDSDDRDVSVASGLTVARAWPDARLLRTSGLGHHRILKADSVVQDTVDFLHDRVVFPKPAAIDDWQSFPGPAPIL